MRFSHYRIAFTLLLAALVLVSMVSRAPEPFRFRGYYITFMRMPTMGLAEWKQTIDCIQHDNGNLLLLWMGGAFRSKKFPVTWEYNREHKNVEREFVDQLIDYAHSRGIKVLLALTPFAYDGVNQYPIEHPELKATQKDGSPSTLWGMQSWGYNLCPSRPESQRFLLDYAREMFFDFYQNADGLMIESSDYAICYCADCKEHFFDKEFQFVNQISKEIWRAKPEAMILVYPHYFSGRKVPGFDVSGARQTFDPRWTLFFTPHSAHIDPELLRSAKTSIYWADSPTLGTPRQIREAAQKAWQFKITGFVPSLEAYSFHMEQPEGGESHLVGTRLKPFGFEWLRDGEMPFNEILVRVNRIAYREFSRNPELAEDVYQRILGAEIFGPSTGAGPVNDLLFLQESLFLDRSWWSASPLLTPAFFKQRAIKEKWTQEKLTSYRNRLERMKQIEKRYLQAGSGAEVEMGRIAAAVAKKWDGIEASIFSQTSDTQQ